MPDPADDSGADGIRVDRDGRLYSPPSMGIQVCDQAGRVNCIIPTPNGEIANLCFGGPEFDTLFATCGDRVYKRKSSQRGQRLRVTDQAGPASRAACRRDAQQVAYNKKRLSLPSDSLMTNSPEPSATRRDFLTGTVLRKARTRWRLSWPMRRPGRAEARRFWSGGPSASEGHGVPILGS